MRKFIIKTALFLGIVATAFGLILAQADGRTDPFYVRFTTPPKDNLILGTSRSAQGLQPSEFRNILGKEFFNYSFTIAHSPFGSVYLNSIKRKLNPDVKDGIYIITVDPWSISNNQVDPNDTLKFSENTLALANVKDVNANPNFEYLFKQFKGEYYKIITSPEKNGFLHQDGWYEVSVPMDSATKAKRLQNKINNYKKENLPGRQLSQVRLDYLQKTIAFLKMHGDVYIVRLPVSREMFAIEEEFMPNFNEIIEPAIRSANGYLDLTSENENYEFTDGNHLWKDSGKIVSSSVARWIQAQRK